MNELSRLADANDQASAQCSLEAELVHWQDGRLIRCNRWLADSLNALAPLARTAQLEAKLDHLHRVLESGNQAMRWLDRHRKGESIKAILTSEAAAMAEQELQLVAASTHTDATPPHLG
jgi:gamma-glutamyl:cysteine ligase YbdK (ATP-grasp superfamily)